MFITSSFLSCFCLLVQTDFLPLSFRTEKFILHIYLIHPSASLLASVGHLKLLQLFLNFCIIISLTHSYFMVWNGKKINHPVCWVIVTDSPPPISPSQETLVRTICPSKRLDSTDPSTPSGRPPARPPDLLRSSIQPPGLKPRLHSSVPRPSPLFSSPNWLVFHHLPKLRSSVSCLSCSFYVPYHVYFNTNCGWLFLNFLMYTEKSKLQWKVMFGFSVQLCADLTGQNRNINHLQ